MQHRNFVIDIDGRLCYG